LDLIEKGEATKGGGEGGGKGEAAKGGGSGGGGGKGRTPGR
jgi:hypothetical protein